MDLHVEREALLRAVRLAAGVASPSETLPILGCLLLRAADEGQLEVVGTDLNVFVCGRVPCQGAKDGAVVVTARALLRLLERLDDADETLHLSTIVPLVAHASTTESLVVAAGAVKLELASQGKPGAFLKAPSTAEMGFHEIDAGVFREMVGRTQHAICKDETRINIHGACLESTGRAMRMVASDAHRLALTERQGSGPLLSGGIVIPRQGLVAVDRLLEPREGEAAGVAELGIKDPYMAARRAGITVIVKLGQGQFPPYEQVFPKAPVLDIAIERKPLLGALRRALALVSNNAHPQVRIELGADVMSLRARDGDNAITERVPMRCESEGAFERSGFNPRFLIQALETMQCHEVTIRWTSPMEPIDLVGDVGDRHVIMPQRLEGR